MFRFLALYILFTLVLNKELLYAWGKYQSFYHYLVYYLLYLAISKQKQEKKEYICLTRKHIIRQKRTGKHSLPMLLSLSLKLVKNVLVAAQFYLLKAKIFSMPKSTSKYVDKTTLLNMYYKWTVQTV